MYTEYGAVLAELTVSQEVGVAYRQLACVLLRQYLDAHWSRVADKFTEPVPEERVCTDCTAVSVVAITELLAGEGRDTPAAPRQYWRPREETKGNHCEITSGTSPCGHLLPPQAYGVAAIAHWDWPEMWPQLLPQLEAALCSGDAHLVHGAMRVLSGKATPPRYITTDVLGLTEFCRDVSDTQMPDVVPVILPQLLRVLQQPQVRSSSRPPATAYLLSPQAYNVRTQSKAVRIFHTLSSIIYAASETTPTLATSLLLPALPQFSEGTS